MPILKKIGKVVLGVIAAVLIVVIGLVLHLLNATISTGEVRDLQEKIFSAMENDRVDVRTAFAGRKFCAVREQSYPWHYAEKVLKSKVAFSPPVWESSGTWHAILYDPQSNTSWIFEIPQGKYRWDAGDTRFVCPQTIISKKYGTQFELRFE